MHGTVRVSTAYGFYEAVKNHLILDKKDYEGREKLPFEATSYQLHYIAANESDAFGKDDVTAVLDRTTMWNCNVVNGSSSSYEFIGLPRCDNGEFIIKKRFLPCPCLKCLQEKYDECTNLDIVGQMKSHTMREIVEAECPDYLTAPLDGYTARELQAFIKLYNNNVVPRECKTKADFIRFIVNSLAAFIVVNHDDEVA